MPRPRRYDFPDFSGKANSSSRLFRRLPALLGNTALNFFDDSWTRQGFVDQRRERWAPRKSNDKRKGNRKILVQSGRLRRSLRMRTRGSRVIISTDVPYAQVHNEGGRIRGKVRVRKHTRRSPRGRVNVRAHTRNVNINMPKRQFMGHSEVLDKRMVALVTRALDQIF